VTSDTVKRARVADLVPDGRNANRGTPRGRAVLDKSLQELGAGRSILVDRNGRIIAGNKTHEAAAGAGLEDVIIVETDGTQLVAVKRVDLDLDDEAARRLAYADNRAAELGLEWDVEQLAADLEAGLDLGGLWNQRELELLLEEVAVERQPETLDDYSSDLPGAAALKPEMNFPSDEPFGIPALLPEMLAPLPEPIDVWAGPDASDADWAGWWLYCYGSDSMRGLDLTRTVLAFYTDDYRFERWFDQPDLYVSKVLNAGLSIAVAPNFSLWHGFPQALHIFNTFRSRWVARYMQEAGLRVIPDANWADEGSFAFCLAGIPVGAPCVSIQVQTVGTEAERKRQAHGVARVIDELRPGSLLLYGGGRETRKNLAGILPDGLAVTWVESRSTRRKGRVMGDAKQFDNSKEGEQCT